jgi:hypothetical protein
MKGTGNALIITTPTKSGLYCRFIWPVARDATMLSSRLSSSLLRSHTSHSRVATNIAFLYILSGPGQLHASGNLSVQRGKGRRVCSLNHQYRCVINLASLGFGIAESRSLQRPL